MRNLLLMFTALLLSGSLKAEILVIVNTTNSITALEHKQIVDLFMGRVSAFPNRQPARPLDLKAGIPLRAVFYKSLTGKSEAQVDAYWATLIFAGRMSPPEQFSNETALIEKVTKDPSAIAYVTRQSLPNGVKIVMELPVRE